MKYKSLIIMLFLTFTANSLFAQLSQKIDLKLENARLKEFFSEIENKTNYTFMYKNMDLNTPVSVDVDQTELKVILNQVLTTLNLDYEISGKHIILKNKSLTRTQQKKKTITGVVYDDLNEPIIGANVVEKGTTNGTITDLDGKFILEIEENAVLQISYIGYADQEISVDNQSNLSVLLTENTQLLDEVVVIGYGSVKKSDLTGAVGSVKGSMISERQTTQISQALQGAIAGVMVTRDNNAPGANSTIRIRGITTIGESNPLVIVDGVPAGSINDVNPNDVQDISVLKDAASASIYGSRAAAGVILLTTKRAKEGDLNLSYNAEYGIEKPTAWPKYANVVRFMEFDNEMRWNDNGNTGTEYSTFPKDVIDNYWALNAENPNLYPNTNWRSLVMKNYAPRTSHNLSVSVGKKDISSKISLNYDMIEGLYKHREYERFNARFNNNITINKFISATADMYWKRSILKDASVAPWQQVHIAPAVYPAVWDDGRLADGKAGANIYGMIEKGGTKDNWYNALGGKASVDIIPLNGLKLSAVVAPNFNFDKEKKFIKKVEYTIYEDPAVVEGTMEGHYSTKLSESRNDNYQITAQFLANYVNSFGCHNINLMAGYENYYAFYEELGASRDQYLLNSYPYLNLGPLEFRDNSGKAYENAYRSYFGRMMYNYKNKYYLQGNIRYDGSSRFHKDYRWGAFPSFSVGWIISEEDFLAGLDNLSFLKLRASWGSLGNERIGNYPYQSTIAFSDALFYEGSDVVSAQTAAQIKYAISDISWETTESFDFGVDANFFDNRLRFTGDYFLKTTKDMLLALEIPDFIGFDNPDQNTGKMETKGWEITLGWNDKAGELKYSVSFNISDFKSTMGDLGGTEFLGDKVKLKDSEFNEWYGYLSDGLFQTTEELENSPKTGANIKAGDVRYKDISGPDGVPDGIISPEYDRVLLGGSLPRYMYGGSIKLEYKGLDFSMVVQGVGKQNSRKTTTMVEPLRANYGNVPDFIDGHYWSAYNTPEQNLNVKYPRLSWSSRGNNYAMSDYWLFDGGYFRLKNITLAYTLPDRVTEKVSLKNVRLYSSISDLFSIDNYPKGWDPEVGAEGYPITTSYVFGISVNF